MIFDAAVLGAGPAGASAARELSKSGVKTVVLEKNKTVSTDKTWVTWKETVNGFGLMDSVLQDFDGFLFRSFLGPRHVVRKPKAVVLDGEKALKKLLEEARAGGVSLMLGREVLSWKKSGKKVSLKTSRGEILAKKVVDATGASSPIAAGMGVKCDRYMGCFAYELSCGGKFDEREALMYDSFFPGEHYFWIVPLGPKKVLAGVFAWKKLDQSFEPLLKKYLRHQDFFPAKTRILGKRFGNIPLQPSGKLCAGNVLFCGDSASQALPSSGFGFSRSMEAGRLAAEAIIGGGSLEESYADEWRRRQSIGLSTHVILSLILSGVSNLKLAEQIGYMREVPHELVLKFLHGSDMGADFSYRILSHAYKNFSLNELSETIGPEEYLDIVVESYKGVKSYTKKRAYEVLEKLRGLGRMGAKK